MKTIGITGGIGSGKSTVCALLADLGACVFDADAEGKALLEHDTDVRRAVADAFGRDAYPGGGPPDKAWLAERIFSSDGARKMLERIIHPAVARKFETVQQNARKDGCTILLKEQAVLPGDTQRASLDAWIVVEAPLSARLDRVMARSGLTRDQARARVQAQPDAAAYRAIADYVVINDGSVADLDHAVQTLWKEW